MLNYSTICTLLKEIEQELSRKDVGMTYAVALGAARLALGRLRAFY